MFTVETFLFLTNYMCCKITYNVFNLRNCLSFAFDAMVIRISYLPPFEAANVLFSIREALCWGLTVENKDFQSLFCSAFSTHLGPFVCPG